MYLIFRLLYLIMFHVNILLKNNLDLNFINSCIFACCNIIYRTHILQLKLIGSNKNDTA